MCLLGDLVGPLQCTEGCAGPRLEPNLGRPSFVVVVVVAVVIPIVSVAGPSLAFGHVGPTYAKWHQRYCFFLAGSWISLLFRCPCLDAGHCSSAWSGIAGQLLLAKSCC